MKAGIFQEDDVTYHANREAIGSTELRQMLLSPRHFFHAWKGGEVREPAEAMETGTLLHKLLLEQDVSQFCARPLNEKGELVRSNSKEYAHFLACNPGKTPIRPELMKGLYDALDAFTQHDKAMELIEGARIEHSVYAQDETGLWCKARPDILGKGYIADLKSTKKLDKNFERSIFSLNYPFQLAHYAQTLADAEVEACQAFFVIGFETQAPFGIKIYSIAPGYITEGIEKRREWLNEISVCMKENKWPSYRNDIIHIERPKYMSPIETESFEVA